MSVVIRVLHISRYYTAAMEAKLEAMAAQPGFSFCLIRPLIPRDEYGREVVDLTVPGCHMARIPMLGAQLDPHRALYRTLTLHMPSTRPHIIHAEEEPDSLSALQVALMRRLYAPKAKLLLHTWQNVNRPKRWKVRQVLRISLREADAILCANREAVEVLRAVGYRGTTAVVPPIGVDTRVFYPRPRCQESRRFRIGYVGRFVAEKGIDVLMGAVSRLSGVELWLTGSGPYQPELQRLAQTLQIADRVSWRPPVKPELLPDILAELDVVVLPSCTTPVWKEQFGRILVESMACGVPVVGSDSGAIPEVIGDAGLVVPEGDVAALTEALARLMSSPSLCQELSERGRARVAEHYTQQRVAERTISAYQTLLASG